MSVLLTRAPLVGWPTKVLYAAPYVFAAHWVASIVVVLLSLWLAGFAAPRSVRGVA